MLLRFFYFSKQINWATQFWENTNKGHNSSQDTDIKHYQDSICKTDTLIIETTWKICGNSAEDELPITFDTKLEDHPYVDNLSKTLV